MPKYGYLGFGHRGGTGFEGAACFYEHGRGRSVPLRSKYGLHTTKEQIMQGVNAVIAGILPEQRAAEAACKIFFRSDAGEQDPDGRCDVKRPGACREARFNGWMCCAILRRF